jgi:predicted NAD/FAD-dependent oxidoreductase
MRQAFGKKGMAIQDVVVVGAGMAGLVCAQRLHQAGYRVSLVEKSRGLGGRMATRRIDGTPLDHGARFVMPTSPQLQTLTQYWVDQGTLQAWQPHTYCLDSNGQLNPATLNGPLYVAPAGMSVLGKALASTLPLYRQERAIAIAQHPTQATWVITTEPSDADQPRQHHAHAVVLALPAPQIEPLLAPLQSVAAIASLRRSLSEVTYAPCITVMAQYAHPPHQPDAPLPCAPHEPWMIEGHSDTSFFWLGLDSSKRNVEGFNVVLHSSATFADHWLDHQPVQPAGEALLAQAGKLVAPWLAKPYRWQVHRWRYAYIEHPHADLLIATQAPVPLVACGDWCGDRQLDTAFESGWAAAAKVNDSLEQRSLIEVPSQLVSDD